MESKLDVSELPPSSPDIAEDGSARAEGNTAIETHSGVLDKNKLITNEAIEKSDRLSSRHASETSAEPLADITTIPQDLCTQRSPQKLSETTSPVESQPIVSKDDATSPTSLTTQAALARNTVLQLPPGRDAVKHEKEEIQLKRYVYVCLRSGFKFTLKKQPSAGRVLSCDSPNCTPERPINPSDIYFLTLKATDDGSLGYLQESANETQYCLGCLEDVFYVEDAGPVWGRMCECGEAIEQGTEVVRCIDRTCVVGWFHRACAGEGYFDTKNWKCSMCHPEMEPEDTAAAAAAPLLPPQKPITHLDARIVNFTDLAPFIEGDGTTLDLLEMVELGFWKESSGVSALHAADARRVPIIGEDEWKLSKRLMEMHK